MAGEWAKATEKAQKEEKDPVEALKLAKRIYGRLRKAGKGKAVPMKAMKAMAAMKGKAVPMKAMKAMAAMKGKAVPMKAMKAMAAMKAMKVTAGTWAKAKKKAEKEQSDPVEALKLAKRIYARLRSKAPKAEGKAAPMKTMKAMAAMKAMKVMKAMK